MNYIHQQQYPATSATTTAPATAKYEKRTFPTGSEQENEKYTEKNKHMYDIYVVGIGA